MSGLHDPHDPRMRSLMEAAFEDAWIDYLQEAMPSSREDAAVMRAAMADLISTAVTNGIRDRFELKQIALGIRQPGEALRVGTDRVDRRCGTVGRSRMMLNRFTLKPGADSGWELINQERAVVRRFRTKAAALEGGVLEALVGEGTVRIHKEDGTIEEERTFPRARDPRSSPG